MSYTYGGIIVNNKTVIYIRRGSDLVALMKYFLPLLYWFIFKSPFPVWNNCRARFLNQIVYKFGSKRWKLNLQLYHLYCRLVE